LSSILSEESEDDASLELTEILEEHTESQKNHKFIVPVIITSNASSPEPSDIMEEPSPTASAIDKRLEFKLCKETSIETSREIFEDAREDFDEEDLFTESLPEIPKETSQEISTPLSFPIPCKTEPEFCPVNGEHEEHSEKSREIIESCPEESIENIQATQTEIELHSTPINTILETAEDIPSQVVLNETSEEVEDQELPRIPEDTHKIPFELATQCEALSDINEERELATETPDSSKEPPTQDHVRVSVSTEDEAISSVEIASTSCTRSYSSQSSRESFGETRVGGDGSGSDTIFLPSPFEEPHVQSSVAEDTKSLFGGSSLGSSSLRDSFSSPVDPRILMGPGNLIVMLGETVNLRVKIQTGDVSGTTVSWCKFVCVSIITINMKKWGNEVSCR